MNLAGNTFIFYFIFIFIQNLKKKQACFTGSNMQYYNSDPRNNEV
jgi:hypothetical protein